MNLLHKIYCFFAGHLFEPKEVHTEWFAYDEDIGPGGGNWLAVVRGSPEDKNSWSDTYTTRKCLFCGKVERL